MGFGYHDYGELAAKKGVPGMVKSGRYTETDETHIFGDILQKAKLEGANAVLNIGCGCSKPAIDLMEFCRKTGAVCVMVDHPNMIAELKSCSKPPKNVIFIAGRFPDAKGAVLKAAKSFDSIIVYSTLHYVKGLDCFKFLDEAASLLSPGGRMLIGDIPNVSKKKRFLSTKWGREFHEKWSGRKAPTAAEIRAMTGQFDDKRIAQIMQRYRHVGYETYLLKQNEKLPFCYSREDILIVKHK